MTRIGGVEMARMRPDDPAFGKWLSVLNQGPMLSSTNIFPLKNMLRSTPSAATARAATVSAGDEAPDAELVSTEGKVVRLQDFRGTPVVMRLTRAVTDRIV